MRAQAKALVTKDASFYVRGLRGRHPLFVRLTSVPYDDVLEEVGVRHRGRVGWSLSLCPWLSGHLWRPPGCLVAAGMTRLLED